jgi:aminoglycoside phosphotransferase family enzyme/predicted kinase
MTTDRGIDLSAQRALVAKLRAVVPRAGSKDSVEVIETLISWVLLSGSFAWKIKKAVDLGFLDFTTLAARRRFCEEELRLNRRLAPALYLDVVPIAGTVDAPVPGGEGAAIEYAVRMREFPQSALASSVLARGELARAHIDALAADIAAFHARIARAPPDGPFGTPQDLLRFALENFEAAGGAAATPDERAKLTALHDWTLREHAARTARFGERRARGFVRECHGDLHLGNMVLQDDRLVVFDCIEFNDHLRWIDVMSEVAFVVMDLEDRGAPALAHRFLNAYLERTGDYAGLAVLRFYLTYRAMVRAKVARLRADQLDPGAARDAALAEFHGYLDLAAHFARPPRPALVLTHGLSGCGKTTLSQALLELTGAVRIRSDVERKRLHGLDAGARTGSDVAGGLYTDQATQATYDHIAALAREVLAAGDIALVDAAFLQRWQRDPFRQLAAELGVPFAIVAFVAPEATLRRRLAARQRQGGDASEADLAVLAHQLRMQEPLAAGEEESVVRFDAQVSPARAGEASPWQPLLVRIGHDAPAVARTRRNG